MVFETFTNTAFFNTAIIALLLVLLASFF